MNREMPKSLRSQFAVLILLAATIGLYYSSLFGVYLKPDVIGIDDNWLMQSLLNHELSFKNIFIPDSAGKYYRPFLGLSYLIDSSLWGDGAFGYRLTNVFIHAANVVLVYLTGALLLKSREGAAAASHASLWAALLFACHPIAVESVSWISGRTDALVVLWSLLAILLYLLWREKKRYQFLVLSFACALGAALSKETGIMVPILIFFWELLYSRAFGYTGLEHRRTINIYVVAAVAVYAVLRVIALRAGDISMGLITAGATMEGYTNSAGFFFASFGFYIKKFFFPYPLNFAITNINAVVYGLAGITSLIAFLVLSRNPRLRVYHFFFLWALLGIVPAAVVSFTSIAWTPWAERYLYASLPPFSFIVILSVFFIARRLGSLYSRLVMAGMTAVLVIFAFSSYQRSHIWNDGHALWHDTFRKSPFFIYAAVNYANSFIPRGMVAEAERRLLDAEHLQGPKHQLFFSLANINVGRGNYSKAKIQLKEAMVEAREDSKLVLMGPYVRKSMFSVLAEIELREATHLHGKDARDTHYRAAIASLLDAYREDASDPFLLYRIAKLYAALGADETAVAYFTQFISRWRNDEYRENAEKMARRLTKADPK